MNILYVHYGDQWIRGSERCLLDLIGNLNRDDYQATLWCNSSLLQSEAEALEIPVIVDDFKSSYDNPSRLSSFKETYYLIKKAVHLINAFDIKLIHVNSAAPCQWMSIAAAISKVPLIGHYHCEYIPSERYLSLSHWVDQIVGVSQAVARPFLEDNIHSDHCRVIYNGIDHHFLNSAEPVKLHHEYGISSDDYAILSVGSLIKRKGYDQLIDAIGLLVEDQIPAKCLIIGGGPERQNLQSQIDSKGLHENVILVGECSNVARFYNSYFDTFISTSTQEVFGLVNAEAAACGLAVIAPNIPGLNEVFESSVNAELYQQQSPENIALALTKLYEQENYRCQLAISGAKHIVKNFSVEHYVKNFERLYTELSSQTKSTKPSPVSYLVSMWKQWLFAALSRRIRPFREFSKVN